MSDTVSVREVGLRDGLQMVKSQISTETKIVWCQKQAAAGFAEIEVTSFVPPKVIPQFADAPDVLQGALKIDGLLASVLVPNAKGASRAMDAGAQKITYVLSASEGIAKRTRIAPLAKASPLPVIYLMNAKHENWKAV